MGKTQSKRSVDITTETKKGAEEEITEKMEKIEDLDVKEVVNGDATIQEKSETEKKDAEDMENDKDMTTEKNIDAQASGDSVEQNKSSITESLKEEGSANAEEISPLADESIKKSKKEKVKKKWSFRSISFGKRDKQKPVKNDEAAEDSAVAMNGAADEKSSPDTEESPKDQPSISAVNEKSEDNHKNGDASEKELKEQQTEDKPSEDKSIDVTANTSNNTNTETSDSVQKSADVSPELSEKTENTAVAVTIENETKVAGHVTTDEASKNGNGVADEINTSESETLATDVTESVEAPAEKIISAEVTNEAATTNGDVDKVHQNGTNAESEQEIEQPKAQIEVNSNTDHKTTAATLDYISSTSINPPNVQVHDQDLYESTEKNDNVQVEDEFYIEKSIDLEMENQVFIESSSLKKSSEKVVIDDNNDGNKTIGTVELSTEPVDTEKSSDEKIGEEPSPPPLPISPPPSQVSVFAFTNNEESVEDSIQIEKSEPEPHAIVNTHIEEEIEILHPSTNKTVQSDEITAETIDNPLTYESDNAQTHSEDVCKDKTETEDNDITDLIDAIQFVHVEIKECEDMPLVENDAISTTADLPEKHHEEEASLAAIVVDEITEKAVEIVSQPLESVEEQNYSDLLQQADNPSSQSDGQTPEDRCNQDICEQIEKSPVFVQSSEHNTDKDCFPQLSTSETQQQTDEKTIFFSKSDNIDAILEEHLIPTKEFANAKDLKENVAAAELTQDLSVTCE